jgi:anti-sigma factor RsiW
MTPSCHENARLIGVLLDGQLDAVKTLDVEEHIAVCESCRERVLLERAIRGSVKRAVRESAASAASAGFRERMLGAMSAERDRLDALQHREEEAISVASASLATSVVLAPKEGKPVRRGLFSWRSAVPLAAAAALVFAWGTVSQGPGPRGVAGAARAGFIGNETLSDLLAEHSSPLPPERTNAKDMRSLERYVGVPVRAPAFKSPRARFVGGRLFNVQREHAAMLQYQLGDGRDGASVQRVTVFIYDPQRIRIASDGLSPRAVGTAEVHVGQAGGHSVAVTQREGVGYALATDLDPEASAQLAAFTVDDE